MKNEQITLIKISKGKGKTGAPNVKGNETRNTVFAEIASIGMKEYYESQAIGKNLSYRATINFVEYAGEQEAEYKGDRYMVERTFHPRERKNDIELYLKAKEGV